MSGTELVAVKINSLAEVEKIAHSMVKSKLFGVESFDQAFSLMMVANARGIHPVKAAMDYHIIQGKPALKADAMLGYFQESGGIVQWKVYTDTCVIGAFSHPRSGQLEPIEIEWTIERASKIMTYEKGQNIRLCDKKVWKEYPRAMLRSRCISEGVRTVYPGIIGGFYTEEEVGVIADNDRFEKAKPVAAKEEYRTIDAVSEPVKTAPKAEISLPEGVSEDHYKTIVLNFKAAASKIRDEYKQYDYDEGCNGDEWVAIHNKLLNDWMLLCDKYREEHEWFVVPEDWNTGMNKLFGIE